MATGSNEPVHINYFLEPGHIFLATKPAVISVVLGSCVSVCVYDTKRKVGGMNHFRLPYIGEKHLATAIYGNVATIALVRMIISDGSQKKHLEAQILGGSHNYDISPKNIGKENIMTARRILNRERISVVSEYVGGEKGRKIVFNTATNELAVMGVERLRAGDWYPYEDDR